MKLLCVDASGKSAACAVTEGKNLLCENFINSGLTHSQTLLPMIDEVLERSGLSIEDIEGFAVTSGPGSFTGLRIGLALVMGLAGSRPCAGVSTLRALAYNMKEHSGIIVPVMDARRNQVYTALYRNECGVFTQLCEDCAISVDEVLSRLEEYKNEKIWVLGDGAYLFEGKSAHISFPSQELLFIRGSSIALALDEKDFAAAKELKINYLRLSQAERELKEKMKNGN